LLLVGNATTGRVFWRSRCGHNGAGHRCARPNTLRLRLAELGAIDLRRFVTARALLILILVATTVIGAAQMQRD